MALAPFLNFDSSAYTQACFQWIMNMFLRRSLSRMEKKLGFQVPASSILMIVDSDSDTDLSYSHGTKTQTPPVTPHSVQIASFIGSPKSPSSLKIREANRVRRARLVRRAPPVTPSAPPALVPVPPLRSRKLVRRVTKARILAARSDVHLTSAQLGSRNGEAASASEQESPPYPS
ncbi:hypothetical protein K438DRAFT_1964822 [Mycena galopus ATCC 62051]|nr:hypothetical protein K438DRAFT_1964822 [Mycena galopus ATCC 62051]